MTMILSSHIVADLERVCDHLVILSTRGRPARRADRRDRRRATACSPGRARPARTSRAIHDVIRATHTERQTTLLVRANGHVYDSRWELHEIDLEEIVLAYLGYDARPPRSGRCGVVAS